MTWNYRVVRKRYPDGSVTYHIWKLYYGDDGTIERADDEPERLISQEVAELREHVGLLSHAFRHPVLEEREVHGEPALVPDSMDETINVGHYFELMDRAYVANNYLHQFLGCHPVLRNEKKLRAAYDRAEEALADIYLHVGGLMPEEE